MKQAVFWVSLLFPAVISIIFSLLGSLPLFMHGRCWHFNDFCLLCPSLITCCRSPSGSDPVCAGVKIEPHQLQPAHIIKTSPSTQICRIHVARSWPLLILSPVSYSLRPLLYPASSPSLSSTFQATCQSLSLSFQA